MNELLMISRYITISDVHFVAKLTGYAYYQGILFWISKFFQRSSIIPDDNRAIENKLMNSKGKVSDLGSKCKCTTCSDAK